MLCYTACFAALQTVVSESEGNNTKPSSSPITTPVKRATDSTRIIRRSEVELHDSIEKGIWCTYKDGVYDITDFLSSHPGGIEKISMVAGCDLNDLWQQPAFHQHYRSPVALQLLEELRIGTLHPDDVTVDDNKTEKRVLTFPTNKIYDCIVIGAGVSGLQCAQTLTSDHGVNTTDVLVLEAQDYIGGRVRQMTEFIKGVNIDIGAEFLHGDHTELTKFAKKYNESYSPIYCWAHGDGGPLPHPVNKEYGLYYVGGEGKDGAKKRLLRFDDKDPDFVHLNETLWGLGHEDPDKYSDFHSLDDYLSSKGVTENMKKMADAGFANTLCTNNKDLSLKRAIMWEKLWHGEGPEDEEECDFQFKGSFKVVVDHLKKNIQVETNSPVKNVTYKTESDAFSDLIKLETIDGEIYYTKSLVVTSSPHVLKSNLMHFDPPLSGQVKEAIDSVNMRNIVKVVLKFSEPVWPQHLKGMIMVDPDFLLPEIWFRNVHDRAAHDEPAKAYAVAFTTSEFAARLASMPRHEVLEKCVGQLDTIFSSLEPRHMSADLSDPSVQQSPSSLKKPSEAFLGGMFWDWNPDHHPYIGGGYCSPRSGKHTASSDILREPYGNKNIFFAGEATTLPGATAHAALESGIRTASQVNAVLKEYRKS